jgi:hypothetical protein
MSLVQTTTSDPGYVTSLVSTAISTTTGNALVVTCASGAAVSTPTDTYSNTWTAHPSNPQAPQAGYFIYMWYCLNITGGTGHEVTFTSSGAGMSCSVSEFSGRSKTAIDNHAVSTTATSTAQTGPTFTVAVNADVIGVLQQVYAGVAVTYTAGSGFTIPTNGTVPGTNDLPVCVEHADNVSAGSYTPSFTSTEANNGTIFALSLPVPAVAALQVSSLNSMNLGPC